VVTDSISNWFFTTSGSAGDNLRRAGVSDDRIFFVGNTMIDTLLAQMPHFRPPEFWTTFDLQPGRYCVLTLHRPANVDDEPQLRRWLHAIADGMQGLPVIFPVHPRTAKAASPIRHAGSGFHYVGPQGYREFNYLVKHAKGVLTDSGGITEEATVMGVPWFDSPRQHRTARNRDRGDERTHRNQSGKPGARAGAPPGGPVEARPDAGQVGRSRRAANCRGVGETPQMKQVLQSLRTGADGSR
jgi:UDP-N-acetylglucosamine 2-epimerase